MKTLKKTLKYLTGIIAVCLLLMFLLPILFPGPVVRKVKSWANESIEGELDFSKLRISFFQHFPSLTATLYDVSLKGSAPFASDTLLAAKTVSLGVNVTRLVFKGDLHIDKIFVDKALVHVLVNKNGQANYNVYRSTDTTESSGSSSSSIRLEKIEISDTRITYDDRSVDVFIDARRLNYQGKGKLDRDTFGLRSRASIDSFTFHLGSDAYLTNKKVEARLLTKINTNSLSFLFERNRLNINQLPVLFRGRFDFLENGYDMDFALSSKNSSLHQLVTVMPPAYLHWLKKTEVRGNVDVDLTLKGKYIASEQMAPTLALDLKIDKGYVNHDAAPFAATDLHLDLHTRLPSLNTDSLSVAVDSIHLRAEKNLLHGKLRMLGLARPEILGRLYASLNIDEVDRAMGLNAGVSGNLFTHAIVNRDFFDITAKGDLSINKTFAEQGVTTTAAIKGDVHFKGNPADAATADYTGDLAMSNIRIGSSYFPKSFLVRDGRLVFNQNKASFSEFKAEYGQSDFLMNGYMENIVNYLLSPSAILRGDFSVRSKFINVNELISDQPSTSDSTSGVTGLFVVPAAYNLSLTADADEILYDDVRITNLRTRLSIDTSTLFLDNTSMALIGCKASLKAKYKCTNPSKANFDFAIKADEFDVKKAYDSVKIFRELASAAAYAQGVISVDYKLKGVLDRNMSPILPSIEGGGTVYLKDVSVKGYKLFSVVSKQTGKDSLDNPNLKKVTIHSTIKNNIINVERFKFKVFGFRPRIEGQTSLDGALNLKMRLGLPPLGIIGIPIKITGTQDEPVIKLGKKTKDLEETVYDDGETPEGLPDESQPEDVQDDSPVQDTEPGHPSGELTPQSLF